MNKVNITGRIANDLEIRKTNSNKSVLEIKVAVKRERKNESGEYPVDFITCYLWEQRAEFLNNYAHKGTLIGISGRIETGSYIGKDNKKVYTTYIQVESVEILSQPQEKPVDNSDVSMMGGKNYDSYESAGIEYEELEFY